MQIGEVFIELPVTVAQLVFEFNIFIYDGNLILTLPVDDKSSVMVIINVYYVLELTVLLAMLTLAVKELFKAIIFVVPDCVDLPFRNIVRVISSVG